MDQRSLNVRGLISRGGVGKEVGCAVGLGSKKLPEGGNTKKSRKSEESLENVPGGERGAVTGSLAVYNKEGLEEQMGQIRCVTKRSGGKSRGESARDVCCRKH